MGRIAIIPARSGSKGLPDKNILPLCGKPLLSYTIEAALESRCFTEVMVSTDSERYAAIARELGAEVPFLRSSENSMDSSSTWDVVREVLGEYEDRSLASFDEVAVLQPTSPLRTSSDIKGACALYNEKGALSVVSVCEVDHSPLWCNTLPANGCMEGFLANVQGRRRQDLDTYYRINGAIYLVDVQLVKDQTSIYSKRTFAYVMPKERSIDIDDSVDFAIAEAILRKGANAQ